MTANIGVWAVLWGFCAFVLQSVALSAIVLDVARKRAQDDTTGDLPRGLMRPLAIQNNQAPNPGLDPAERFRRFLRAIVSVPKAEADKKGKQPGRPSMPTRTALRKG